MCKNHPDIAARLDIPCAPPTSTRQVYIPSSFVVHGNRITITRDRLTDTIVHIHARRGGFEHVIAQSNGLLYPK